MREKNNIDQLKKKLEELEILENKENTKLQKLRKELWLVDILENKEQKKLEKLRKQKKWEIKKNLSKTKWDKKIEKKKYEWMKWALIWWFMVLAITYWLNFEKVQEAISTIIHEWPENFIEQTENYINQEEESEKAQKVADYINEFNETKNKKNFTIKQIGDTIFDNANHFRVPVVINLAKENRFNYRNRWDTRDLNNTDWAIISTFKPFVHPKNYKSKLAENNNESTVIALNKNTWMISAGNFEEFKDKSEYVVSETWKPKKVIDVDISKKNEYIQNIYQKWISLVLEDSSKISFPIGIGKEADGNFLWWYSGGKVLIFSPDHKHGWFIYGTANMIKEQIKNFRELYKTDYVLWYDVDQKSYSQTIQTKNKKISWKELIKMDNFNSAMSGSGNILYLDNDLHK